MADARTGDVIYTNMPTQGADAPIPNVQYFWEAFPSGSGSTDRTTYLFTYLDADPSRCPTLSYKPLLLRQNICCYAGLATVERVTSLGIRYG